MNNIIFLNCTQSYPTGFSADNTKVELMARGLKLNNNQICIINTLNGEEKIQHKVSGVSGYGLSYIMYPFHNLLYKAKLSQFLSWIMNLTKLYDDLKAKRSVTDKNILFLGSCDYHLFLTYILYAKLLNYKTVFIFHEWGIAAKSVHILRKPSIWLLYKTFGFFVDGILPISQYLVEKSITFKKKYLKLPILSEYIENEQLQPNKNSLNQGYFLYCAHAAYKSTIEFIIQSYLEFKNLGGKDILYLILSGSNSEIKNIQERIAIINQLDNIIIKSKLPYNELFDLYRNSIALLIPLDPQSLQDKARFSQKIAEYLSSYRPIITTSVGEIPYYFKNRQTAYIVNSFSPTDYANIMFEAVNENEIANKIGYNGRQLGNSQFNYINHGNIIHQFLIDL